MLIPTQGKGVGSRSFFEADFGKSSSEFVRYLCMPEKLILNRGKISKTSRGNSKESEEEYSARRKEWNKYQQKIEIWNIINIMYKLYIYTVCITHKQYMILLSELLKLLCTRKQTLTLPTREE